jgi:hypothetical protein
MNSIPINLEIKRFQNLIEKIKESNLMYLD